MMSSGSFLGISGMSYEKKTIKTYSIIFSLDRVSIFLKLKASNILHELLYVPIYGIKLKFDNNSTSNIS